MKLVRDYVSCFERSLTGRDDCGFFVCGQLCKYIRRLSSRCLSSSSVPGESEWLKLLDLDLNSCSKMAPNQFLAKMRLTDQVALGSKHKAERELSETKGSRSVLDKLASTLNDNFATSGRNYTVFLLESVLKHVTLSSDLVKGMGSFDPQVIFVLPVSLGVSLFRFLVRGFTSCGWIRAADEQLYIDEYTSFIEDLRKDNPEIVVSLIYNVVEYLMSHTGLCFRQHLAHIFKLSCLCLTSTSTETPVIKFGSINSSDYSCKLGEVLYPVHSYASNVPRCVDSCASSDALADFVTLDSQYGGCGFSSTYDPWSFVDWFDRQSVLKKLEKGHSSLLRKRGESSPKKVSLVSTGSAGPKTAASIPSGSRGTKVQSVDRACTSSSK